MLGEEDPEAAGTPATGLIPVVAGESTGDGLSAGVRARRRELKGAGAGDGTTDMLELV